MVSPLRRRAGLLLVVVLCGLQAVASGSAAGATVVAHGNVPDAVVDRDGITHLVWNEVLGGGNPDVLHYCQIPAGGTACVHAQSFTPPSDQPSINGDLYGPHVMVTPFGEVILLTNRCCSNQVVGRYAPNVLYVSDDGGLSFGAPSAVGNNPPGSGAGPSPAVFDGADRRVVTASPRADGVRFQAAPVGQWTEASARLSTTEDRFAS